MEEIPESGQPSFMKRHKEEEEELSVKIITVYVLVLVSVVASFPVFHKFQVQPVFSCLLGDMLFHSY